MDCEYVFEVWILGKPLHARHQFHASTPEEAETAARQLFIDELKKIVAEFPFTPPMIKGTLFRGFKDFDSTTYIHPAPVEQ